jgi:hypothetical protein
MPVVTIDAPVALEVSGVEVSGVEVSGVEVSGTGPAAA